MKKYLRVLFVLTICLAISLNVMTQEDECEVNIPNDAQFVTKERVIISSNQSYVIGNGSDVSVAGSHNFLIVRELSTVTINGSNNELYVSSGCTVTLPGSFNTVYAAQGSSVTSLGLRNSITKCQELTILDGKTKLGKSSKSKRSKQSDMGLGDAVKILSDIGVTAKKIEKIEKTEKSQGKKDQVMTEVSADPSNHLIGTWNVVSASALGQEFPVSGKIILNKRGLGYQNYEVEVLGEKYPQIGLFKWRSDDSFVYVNENEDFASNWKRLANQKDFQKVEVKLEGGVKAQLTLTRKK